MKAKRWNGLSLKIISQKNEMKWPHRVSICMCVCVKMMTKQFNNSTSRTFYLICCLSCCCCICFVLWQFLFDGEFLFDDADVIIAKCYRCCLAVCTVSFLFAAIKQSCYHRGCVVITYFYDWNSVLHVVIQLLNFMFNRRMKRNLHPIQIICGK